jgi:PKD repeat protein
MNTGKVAVFMTLATILLFSLVTYCSAGTAPALPCEFYGTVTIDGSAAPVGTILVAKIGDSERGKFVLDTAGKYGGAGTFDSRLKVIAEDSDLAGGSPEITFWINGVKALQTSKFTPGASVPLDLSVGGAPVTQTDVSAQATESQVTASGTTGNSTEQTASDTATTGEVSGSENPAPVSEKAITETVAQMISDMPPQLPEMLEGIGLIPEKSTESDDQSVKEPGKPGMPDVMITDFKGEPTVGIAPLLVQFRDISTQNPTKWAWDFGDGTTDVVQNPLHQFKQVGKYTVKLTASNEKSSSSVVKNNYITVTDSNTLTAAFTAEPISGNPPLSVKFTDTSSGSPSIWAWAFGDGTGDVVQNPTHTYQKVGKYSVNLTISDRSGHISNVSKRDMISVGTPPPVPVMTPVAVPSVPETFVGTAEVYGQPIQSGGTIEARVPGYNVSGVYNPIKAAKGMFGRGGTFSPKLQIQGIPAGTDIEFYAADVDNRLSRAYILKDDGTYAWTVKYEPGQEKVLNLEVLKTPPTDIPPIPVTPVPTTCAGVPSIPMSIEGDVHITNGTEYLDDNGVCYNCGPNILVGGVIEARVKGHDVSGPTNPYTTTSAGYFGSGNSSWADKLSIQGKCLPTTANVTFWVKNPDWPQYTQAWIIDETNSTINYSVINTSITATREIPYLGGSSKNVRLWAGSFPEYEVTPTPTPTPSAWEPQSFYGKAQFNEYPLRVGDRVMATTEGVDLSNPTNPISVVKFGEYSDTAGQELLTVDVPYVSMAQGAPIYFWIKPQGFDYWYKALCKNPLSGANWSYSYPFSPGSITNLDLKSSDREDFMYFNDIVDNLKSPILPDNYKGW